MNPNDCPLFCSDLSTIKQMLMSLTFWELDSQMKTALSMLSPGERTMYNLEHYVTYHDDREGRIKFLLRLIKDEKIAVLHIPPNFENDTNLNEVLGRKKRDFRYLFPDQETAPAAEPEVLTDEMEVVSGPFEVTNPRWEHKDEDKKSNSPDKASIGDTIVLQADISNFPDGATVTFDIFDTTGTSPFRIKTVNGKNLSGVGTCEWVVEDPNDQGEKLKIAFEAIAKSKSSNKKDISLLVKFMCNFAEIPDILFNHGSAIPCLDNEGVLIGALCEAFVFSQNNSDCEVVLFGHADTSGDPAFNYDLSGWRAEGIKALCDNDCDAFLDVVDLASKIEDCQTILKSLADGYGWPTDPGAVDNVNGAKTIAAVKAFQKEYNSRFSENLKTDGVVGSKTWTAIFKVLRDLIETAVKGKTGGTIPSLNYAYGGNAVYACGESFPIEEANNSNYRSKTNRRVEIVFFDKGTTPPRTTPANTASITKKEVTVYDETVFQRKPLSIKNISGSAVQAVSEIPQLNFIEIEDSLFRFSSAVFLPDKAESSEHGTLQQDHLSGAAMVKAILMRAFKHPEQKILITGHTDTSGSDELNFNLSLQSAKSVYYTLIKNKDEWVKIAEATATIQDKQHYLKWAQKVSGSNCDPGEIDGKEGQQTEAATKAFQKQSGLTVDGEIGPKTWGAFFDLLQENISEMMQSDDTEKNALANRSNLSWAYSDQPAVGCGELWPLQYAGVDGMKSQTNRRVEVLFLDEKQVPDCVCKDGKCKKENCLIYPEGLWKRCYIDMQGNEIGNLEVCLDVPVAGVTIQIEGPEIKTGVTNESGKVMFNNVKAGSYTVRIV